MLKKKRKEKDKAVGNLQWVEVWWSVMTCVVQTLRQDCCFSVMMQLIEVCCGAAGMQPHGALMDSKRSGRFCPPILRHKLFSDKKGLDHYNPLPIPRHLNNMDFVGFELQWESRGGGGGGAAREDDRWRVSARTVMELLSEINGDSHPHPLSNTSAGLCSFYSYTLTRGTTGCCFCWVQSWSTASFVCDNCPFSQNSFHLLSKEWHLNKSLSS